uniref:Uncharacterized protein n=1 Tax=Fagus sylvatica TaxID=28930 RepID=A0A2N9GD82_FAGSY
MAGLGGSDLDLEAWWLGSRFEWLKSRLGSVARIPCDGSQGWKWRQARGARRERRKCLPGRVPCRDDEVVARETGDLGEGRGEVKEEETVKSLAIAEAI